MVLFHFYLLYFILFIYKCFFFKFKNFFTDDRSKSSESMKVGKYKLYSEELGINLTSGNERELFKWFLASMLFGHRISENIAKKTYMEFERRRVTTPDAIISTGWEGLVEILDSGGFTRYDFSTADRLLENVKILKEKYEGKVTKLNEISKSPEDLERILREFVGFGPITINIFLRELRMTWKNADPKPLPIVYKMAKKLGIKLPKNRKTMSFIRIEAELIRKRKEIKREEKKRKTKNKKTNKKQIKIKNKK